MGYNFFIKSNIDFGRGALGDLAEIIKGYNLKSVMVVYDGGVKAAGIADKVLAEVEKAGVDYTVFDGVIPNPTNEVAEEAAELARQSGVEGFVAVGGGSSIDLAKAVARRIFDIKAEAESEAHGVPVDEVQFHEVGAVDSIVDIVGAAICSDHLGVDKVCATSVPTGYGTITCAVGELPVPAPATQAIIKNTGLPNYRSDIEQELLTPTGAAILAGIVDEFIDETVIDDMYSGSKEGEDILTGRGTGKRDTGLSPLCLLLRTVVRE